MMIQVNKGASNSIPCTLYERQTLTSPYFLVRMKSMVTSTETSCICSDTSSYPQRYNLLTLTESDSPTRTSGQASLPAGEWYYWIYEQSSESNLDYTQASTMLEEGLMKVIGTATTIFTQPAANTQFSMLEEGIRTTETNIISLPL